jgi:hypothetical protein
MDASSYQEPRDDPFATDRILLRFFIVTLTMCIGCLSVCIGSLTIFLCRMRPREPPISAARIADVACNLALERARTRAKNEGAGSQ